MRLSDILMESIETVETKKLIAELYKKYKFNKKTTYNYGYETEFSSAGESEADVSINLKRSVTGKGIKFTPDFKIDFNSLGEDDYDFEEEIEDTVKKGLKRFNKIVPLNDLAGAEKVIKSFATFSQKKFPTLYSMD